MRKFLHNQRNDVFASVLVLFLSAFQNLDATKLVDVKVVDKDYLEVYFKDGDVTFLDLSKGIYLLEITKPGEMFRQKIVLF